MNRQPGEVYQIKVTLRGSRPPIWRRFQVPGDVTLYRLHRVLQVVMGWTDSHLHQFIVNEIYYRMPDPDDIPSERFEVRDERRARLQALAPQVPFKFVYEYDFGDSWRHELLVEAVQEPRAGSRYPTCLAGKRACPPEDCGGIWGYADFLRAIADPRHPEHETMREWIGGSFDPEAFDLEDVNAALRRMR